MNKNKDLSILITDDDAQNRIFIITMMQNMLNNAQIDQAFSGDIALNMIQEKMAAGHHYDVIFMDFKMPGLNGEETTNAIRALEKNHPQLAKSLIFTWSSVKDKPYAQADDWLPKPPHKQELEDLLLRNGLLDLDIEN